MAEVNVKGLRQLQGLLRHTADRADKGLRLELRQLAEPIRSDAESLAVSGIRKVGPRWGKMRVGVTQSLVYVAPKQRGIKTRGYDGRRRPRFADLMESRAMTPALDRNRDDIARGVDDLFTRIARDWNRV